MAARVRGHHHRVGHRGQEGLLQGLGFQALHPELLEAFAPEGADHGPDPRHGREVPGVAKADAARPHHQHAQRPRAHSSPRARCRSAGRPTSIHSSSTGRWPTFSWRRRQSWISSGMVTGTPAGTRPHTTGSST